MVAMASIFELIFVFQLPLIFSERNFGPGFSISFILEECCLICTADCICTNANYIFAVYLHCGDEFRKSIILP